MKIRMDIKEIEKRKAIPKSLKPSEFFKKINKIDNPLTRLRERENHLTKIKNLNGDIVTNTTVKKDYTEYYG